MDISFFEGRAFVDSAERPLQQLAIGNPSLVCFSNKLLSSNHMAEIARLSGSPMTGFVAPGSSVGSNYELRYYSPSGLEVDLCGHATMVITYFLKKYISDEEIYNYNLNPAFLSGKHFIRGVTKNNKIGLHTNAYKSKVIDLGQKKQVLALALNVDEQEITEVYQTELNDFIFILSNNASLRSAHPDFEQIISIGNSILPHRTLVLTTESAEPGFDYEARVFAPGIGVNEDIACGSVNCSLSPIWSKQRNSVSMKMFYCTPSNNKILIGGVQTIKIEGPNLIISSNTKPTWMQIISCTDSAKLFADPDFRKLMNKVSKSTKIETNNAFVELAYKKDKEH